MCAYGLKVIVIDAEELLNEPRTVAEFDLRWVDVDELQRVASRQFVSVEKAGVVRAIAVWFECDFNPDCCDEWKFEVNLSTAPGLPDTHWKQTCIILPTKGGVINPRPGYMHYSGFRMSLFLSHWPVSFT